jgi:hypothetical protein
METALRCLTKPDSPAQEHFDGFLNAASRHTVFLAGSIDAHASLEFPRNWRDEATEVLTAAGYLVLNPLRHDDYSDSAEIMRRNTADLLQAHILLVEMSHSDISYIGTSIEIYKSYQYGKEILLWGGANRRSHALRHYAPVRFETLKDALNELVERMVAHV